MVTRIIQNLTKSVRLLRIPHWKPGWCQKCKISVWKNDVLKFLANSYGKIHKLQWGNWSLRFFRDEPAAAAKITRQFKLELVHNMLVKVHFLTLRYYQNI